MNEKKDIGLLLLGWGKVRTSLFKRALGTFPEADWLERSRKARIKKLKSKATRLMARKDYRKAAHSWQALRDLAPEAEAGFREGAKAWRSVFEADKAEAILLDAKTRFPDKPWPLASYAETAAAMGDYPEAARRWQRLRAAFPENPRGYKRGITTLRAMHDDTSAEALIQEAQQRFPDQLWPYTERAELAMSAALYGEAARRWARIRDRFPDAGIGWQRGVAAHRSRLEFDAAEDLAREGRKLFPQALELAVEWAEIAMTRREYAEAAMRWAEVREAFPDTLAGYARGIRALAKSGQKREADALLERTLTLFPDDSNAHLARVQRLADRKNWAEAERACKAFQQAFPQRLQGYRMWVHALQQQDKTAEAERLLLRFLSFYPHDADMTLRLIRIRQAAGKTAEAITLLRDFYARHGDFFPYGTAFYEITHELLLRNREQYGIQSDTEDSLIEILLSEPLVNSWDLYNYESVSYLDCSFHKLRLHKDRKALLTRLGDILAKRLTQAQRPQRMAQYVALRYNLIGDPDAWERCFTELLPFCPPAAYIKLLSSLVYTGRLSRLYSHVRQCLEQIPDEVDGVNIFCLAYALMMDDQDKAYHCMEEALVLAKPERMPPESAWGTLAQAAANRRCLLERGKGQAAVFIRQRSRPLRIGICVSGQLRGYQEARSTWKHFLLDGHEVDTFVHTWQSIGRKWPTARHAHRAFTGSFLKAYEQLPRECIASISSSKQFFKRLYPHFYQLLHRMDEQTVSRQELVNFYQTDHVVVDDDREEWVRPFNACGSTAMKMHYKLEQCFRLLEATGKQYDLVLRVRPDMYFAPRVMQGVDWHELYRESLEHGVLFSDCGPTISAKNWLANLGGPILGDCFAAGCFDAMRIHAHTYSEVTANRTLRKYYCVPRSYRAHTPPMSLAFYNGLIVKCFGGMRHPEKLCQPATIPIAQIYEALKADVASRPEQAFDLLLLAACEEDLAMMMTLSSSSTNIAGEDYALF